ncbi:MAG: LLM class F420-dependent oxidoreductase [Acidimicrobiia bacterium]|nr:LLM class F420-dependent oxidoreductase [Acidimicrobiia bacterium]
MKFGLFTPSANPFASPEFLAAMGREADERGIDSIWVPEHVVLFDEYASSYPYSPDGRIPAPPGSGILDPFVTLSYLAACTQRVRLATGICLLPQRNPVYTAKEVATLDWLTHGRIDLGIGVGWLREEFEALQVPFERRGRRTDDYVEVLKTLWCDETPSFDGEFYTLPECRQDPKPVQDPHPPLHFGGESDAALRRVARVGQGWHTFSREPEDVPERLETLDGFLAERGRSRDELVISACPYFGGIDVGKVERYAEAGVDQVVAFFFAEDADGVPGAMDAMTDVIERAHQL